MVLEMPSMSETMSKRKPNESTPPAPPVNMPERIGRTYRERKEYLHSVYLLKDEAEWALEIADNEGVMVAEVLSPIIREYLWQQRVAILRQKARALEAGEDYPRRRPPG